MTDGGGWQRRQPLQTRCCPPQPLLAHAGGFLGSGGDPTAGRMSSSPTPPLGTEQGTGLALVARVRDGLEGPPPAFRAAASKVGGQRTPTPVITPGGSGRTQDGIPRGIEEGYRREGASGPYSAPAGAGRNRGQSCRRGPDVLWGCLLYSSWATHDSMGLRGAGP